MAIVDAVGVTSGGVLAIVDVTHRSFDPIVAELLPRGRAWDREDLVLQKLVRAEATELSRVDRSGNNLLAELDPRTTFDCITDWELSYGLPECAAPDTLEARRAAVLAKLLAQAGHGQDIGYWTDLLMKLGYYLHWHAKGKLAMTCTDGCMGEITDEAWQFVWQVAVDSGLDDALLECLVAHNAQIETVPIVHYLWTLVDLQIGNALLGVACTGQGYIAAVGAGGLRVYTGVDLDAWSLAAFAPSHINAVCAIGEVLLAVGAATVDALRSLDGGATWTQIAFVGPTLYGISRGDEGGQVAVAVGAGGACWRTTNLGTGWTELAPQTAATLRAITRCTGAMVAVGDSGVIVRGTNNGLTWALVVTSATNAFYGVGAWKLVVVAVGDAGQMWRSVDAGQTWSQLPTVTKSTLRAVAASPSGRWTACGDGGSILQSLDQGLTWTEQVSPTTETLFGACAYLPGGRTVLVGGTATVILE